MIAPVTENERRDWLRLARTPSVGPVTFFRLLSKFGTPSRAIEALPSLAQRAGRKARLTAPDMSRIDAEIEATHAHGATLILATDDTYPPLLKTLSPPPPVLTALGRPELAAQSTVAIVGARNASAAGRKIARDLAARLSAAGHVIVSGLARGIDGEAHAASLSGGTIAVLGGGIDHIYPPQHERLYAAIAEKGLILSESPFGHTARAKDFPRRNRLVTGCARGVVVVEATERSGSLISARTAGEQGREVMAVPGSPLDPRAAGTNRLLQQGASLVRDGDDVLEILTSLSPRELFAPPAPDFEPESDAPIPQGQIEAVRAALAPYAMPLDDIARAAEIGAGRCAAILVELELAGEATTLAGGLAARNVGP